MGIYYSSVGTRLINYLHHEDLTVEDFAVLDPKFVRYIHNLGKKSQVALLERLEEKNLQPGKWDGTDLGLTWYQARDYYKVHRAELRQQYPPKYIEQPEPEKPKEDWEEYRKKLAKEILLLLLQQYKDVPDPDIIGGMAVGYTDALIVHLKEIH